MTCVLNGLAGVWSRTPQSHMISGVEKTIKKLLATHRMWCVRVAVGIEGRKRPVSHS